MRHVASRLVTAALVLSLSSAAALLAQQGTAPSDRPRLLVLIVADSLRADYFPMYGRHWTRGLRRIFDSGATFQDARHPFGDTKTCAGHASISTGTVPATHGMIDNTWYERAQGRFVTCTEDPAAQSVGFGGARGVERHSGTSLLAPTLGDELRRQSRTAPFVVSLSYKPRSAVGLAGAGGPNTLVVWQEDNGTWATSTRITTARWPDVDAFVRSHPIARARGQLWNRLLPATAYEYEDVAPGEPAPAAFPHLLDVPPKLGGAGVPFPTVWGASPLSDEFLNDLAITLVERLRLGRRSGTDLLAISYSALDMVTHAYGPRSHEAQDMLLRLDVLIERLLDVLDRRVGRDAYVLALSADHGMAPLPEQAPAGAAGRVSAAAVAGAVNEALGTALGRRAYVDAVGSTYLYFRPDVLDRVAGDAQARAVVEKAVLGVRGVERIYWAADLTATAPTPDSMLAALRRSYRIGRSGDVAFVPYPNWVVVSSGTTHGTPHDYDARVPIVFFGKGIKPGQYDSATTIDIAPTLAALAGITMPRAEGRVLQEILERD